MPWRTPPHFSITRRTTAGDGEWTAEIWEKSREREGIVKLGLGGEALESGLGFLRWWSLMREWSLSAIRVSSADKLVMAVVGAVWGLSFLSSSERCASEDDEDDEKA